MEGVSKEEKGLMDVDNGVGIVGRRDIRGLQGKSTREKGWHSLGECWVGEGGQHMGALYDLCNYLQM